VRFLAYAVSKASATGETPAPATALLSKSRYSREAGKVPNTAMHN
jgi:hypothetical protein